MYYITVRQSPMYKNISLEEFLTGTSNESALINTNVTNTKTCEVKMIPRRFRDTLNVDALIAKLHSFNEETASLREKPRHELYREFHIPKKSGGLRKIDAPNDDLMNALRKLKTIFENDFRALYHTSAFAYIKGRSTKSCIERHQANESKWFGKYDLSNFFGSTTMEFVMHMLSMIYPFSEVIEYAGTTELEKALELAFLDGGLPQGTPISPTITNIMMIPVDFVLTRKLRDYDRQKFVYTRYADDFQISSRYTFDFRDIEKLISDTLKDFGAPFQINSKKTRYGSSSGQNYNLGLMLNKENEITVGYKKKRQFKAMLSAYVMDKQHGIPWDISDIQTMEGQRSYIKMVEGETVDRIIDYVNNRFNTDVMSMIKQDLAG